MKVHIYHSIEYAYEFDELAGHHCLVPRCLRSFAPDPHRPLLGWDTRRHRHGPIKGPHETIETPDGWRLGHRFGSLALHHDSEPSQFFDAEVVCRWAAAGLDGFRSLDMPPLALYSPLASVG